MRQDGPASSMRGRLSDGLLSAVCEGTLDALLRRLGDRSTLDEPVFGASSGEAGLRAHVTRLHDWMNDRAARFEKSHTLVGTTLDVAEGMLFFGPQGARQSAPVAVVIERRPDREVAVRVHWSLVLGASAKGPALPGAPIDVTGVMGDALAALSGSPHKPCFEERLRMRDGAGKDLPLDKRVPRALVPTSFADDGRCAACEVSAGVRAGVIVFERGESGMVRQLRIYGDV